MARGKPLDKRASLTRLDASTPAPRGNTTDRQALITDMDQYAVIGNPIEHSKSPLIHAAFARQTDQQLAYGRILGQADTFEQQIRQFFVTGRGLNITLPFKEQAWRLADESSARARSAGAANTLIKLADGRLRADNTDGAGLVRDLMRHDLTLSGREILLLGAGGAARGVLAPLLEQQPLRLLIANRTAAKALALASELSALGALAGSGLEALAGQRFDLIINATSAGLHGQLPALPDDCLRRGGAVYDMVYADQPTAFVRWAQAHGAALALDGLGMLVEQAAEAFFLWRGVRPDSASIMRMLREQ
jgi:shikimate dehydrogenase